MAKKLKIKSKRAKAKSQKAKLSTDDGEDWGAVTYEFNYQCHTVDPFDHVATFSKNPKIKFEFPNKNQWGELCEVRFITNIDVTENGFVKRLLATAKIYEDMFEAMYEKCNFRCDYLKANVYSQKSRLLGKMIDELENDYYVFV